MAAAVWNDKYFVIFTWKINELFKPGPDFIKSFTVLILHLSLYFQTGSLLMAVTSLLKRLSSINMVYHYDCC